MIGTRCWGRALALGVIALATGCGDGGCAGESRPGQQGAAAPQGTQAAGVAMEPGCDPDALPGQSCFVFPVSTAHEALLRGVGTAKALAERLVARKVTKITIKDDETVVSTLQVDASGRIVGEREGGTSRTVAYDAEGRVTLVRVEAEGAMFLEKMVLRAPTGDECAVTTTLSEAAGGPRAESIRCWTEGDTLHRDTPNGVVEAKVSQGRVDYSNGASVVSDAQGRTVERKDGSGVVRFEFGEGTVSEQRPAGDDWRELNVIELDAAGLPLRQVFPAAAGYKDRVLTFSYE